MRWRDHPSRTASIKNMSSSEISRRRLKTDVSAPEEPERETPEDDRAMAEEEHQEEETEPASAAEAAEDPEDDLDSDEGL